MAMTLSLLLSRLLMLVLTGRVHVLRRAWHKFVRWVNAEPPCRHHQRGDRRAVHGSAAHARKHLRRARVAWMHRTRGTSKPRVAKPRAAKPRAAKPQAAKPQVLEFRENNRRQHDETPPPLPLPSLGSMAMAARF